ncbi:spermidine synthase [Saccharopolyspora spinosa]|uniref:Spermidine synthase n=1 Tax=Saccharopolyspora spinosa TaxID=60894 RepID=A0A2N3XU26_SACSN|nr:fused MFS/spermidine synthase [Saccharopolyspora spinosa]PKW14196.1 spermidine synthase [Saccharopolyspora spinosa]
MIGLERVRVEAPVRFGVAELIPDRYRECGWTVAVDGVAQSYVDLREPGHLKMPFADWIGQAIDRHWPSGDAVSALFVGGAGCTLPRYLAATRPGSEQVVFELDGALVELVREHLELDQVPGLEVRVQDGGNGVEDARDASADLVVLDVFRAGDVVTELATVEFLAEISRVLRDGGLYAANMWDAADLGFALRVVASVCEVFPHVLVLAEPGVLLRRRAGNVVVVASTRRLPMAGLVEWGAAAKNRVSCLAPRQLAAVSGTAAPLTEAEPLTVPVPPVRRWGDGSRFA